MNYSKEFKEEALKLSDEIGLKAAAQLGIKYYNARRLAQQAQGTAECAQIDRCGAAAPDPRTGA